MNYDATLQFDSRAEDKSAAAANLARELQELPWKVIAVLPGAETGVIVGDLLAAALPGMRSNPLELSVARRNKYVMGETVRKAGLRAVKQLRATAWPGGCDALPLP